MRQRRRGARAVAEQCHFAEHLAFVDLRDHYGLTQCVIDVSSPLFEVLEAVRPESVITVTGLPALSVPCGFTRAGLPVGLQIVGGPRCDFEVLQVAHAFEQAIDLPPTASAPDPG